jgi:Ca2+-binding EF-hand superfamily protein
MTSKTTLTALTLAAVLGVAAYTALPAGAQDGGMGMGMGMADNSRMPPFETADADKDGKITPAEIAALRKATVLGSDANADGKLSAEELTAQQVRSMTERAAARSARMILMLDVDGDGLLSVEEMAAGPGPMRMFDRLDSDGDGAITKAEADAAAERMQGRQGGKDRDGRNHNGRGHGEHGGEGQDGRGQGGGHHGGQGSGGGMGQGNGSSDDDGSN